MPLLGFQASSGDIGNYNTLLYDLSSDVANMNSVQNIYIKCDITNGIYQDSKLSNLIATVVPDRPPFSTIEYIALFHTRNPVTVSRIDQFTITLVGDQNLDLDMGTLGVTLEPQLWSCLTTIEEAQLKLSREQNYSKSSNYKASIVKFYYL